jgi:hypothetical protein
MSVEIVGCFEEVWKEVFASEFFGVGDGDSGWSLGGN